VRVAIVHERFTELGGSERVVEQLHALWPGSALYAAVVDPAAVPPALASVPVRASRLQPYYRGSYAPLLPFLPGAMAGLDLGDVDLVLTSHHAFANRVRPRPSVPVVSYTHTPARWMWDPAFLRNERGGVGGRAALAAFARSQRRADAAAARRARLVIANSRHVANRVRRWWGVEPVVIPPPVDVDRFRPEATGARDDFFLLAGRLVPYKRPEVAVAAAVRAGVRLVVAGDGRMRAAAEAAAGPGVEFLGHVEDAVLADLYRRCRALVFPGEEDFGLVAVEAQACGAPVLARRVGGVLDSVLDGVTGSLYVAPRGQEVEALAGALRRFDPDRFDPAAIRRHAEAFSPEVFRRRVSAAVGAALGAAAPAA
jgi:glycosyltransferase involved in cell wall biosynthesis